MRLLMAWDKAIFEDVRGYTLDLSGLDVSVSVIHDLELEDLSLSSPIKRGFETRIYVDGKCVCLRNTPVMLCEDKRFRKSNEIGIEVVEVVVKPEDEDLVYYFLEPYLDLFAVRE